MVEEDNAVEAVMMLEEQHNGSTDGACRTVQHSGSSDEDQSSGTVDYD